MIQNTYPEKKEKMHLIKDEWEQAWEMRPGVYISTLANMNINRAYHDLSHTQYYNVG